jgi:pyruvate dehydrogenase E1 component beta subunit
MKGLLIAAIRDANPVICIEHRRLYDLTGDVPEVPYAVPIGQGAVARAGVDVTIVAFSAMVPEALAAAEALAAQGIDAEVVDPRSAKPLDTALILASVRKTGRLIVADTAWSLCGLSAEVAAVAAEQAFDALKAPVRRIALPDIPTPTTPSLERVYYPGAGQIVAAACELLGRRPQPAAAERDAEPAAPVGSQPSFRGPF